jgi:hypothetical protein
MIRLSAGQARALGRELAGMVRQVHAARRLWMRAHPDEVEFWVLTEETDASTERRLYKVGAALQRRHPDIHVVYGVLNPRLYDRADPTETIPDSAEEIPLPDR